MVRSNKSKLLSNKPRQVRDPEATKAQILDAAEEEFAKYGLNGARTEAIAARSGVTKAMIYYYFESKEGLYQEVLQHPVTEFLDVAKQLHLEQLSAEEALKSFVRGAIAYEAAHRHRGMILFHEANQNQGKYFQLTGWRTAFEQMFAILERGMSDGSFRKVDPLFATMQIAGVCTFYFNAHENLKHLFPDMQLLSPEMIEQYTEDAIALILAGVIQEK